MPSSNEWTAMEPGKQAAIFYKTEGSREGDAKNRTTLTTEPRYRCCAVPTRRYSASLRVEHTPPSPPSAKAVYLSGLVGVKLLCLTSACTGQRHASLSKPPIYSTTRSTRNECATADAYAVLYVATVRLEQVSINLRNEAVCCWHWCRP